MNIVDAAAQVYGASLADFVTTRTTLAKQATDRAVATQIRGLRKPTVAAWLANQLARRHPDELDRLVRIGDEMRDATTNRDGARLRELTAEGRQHVATLVAHARRIADETGQAVSVDAADALDTTLHTAMADPKAAQVVLSGRLTRPLEHAGFGLADAVGGPADVVSLATSRPRPEQRVADGSDGTAGSGDAHPVPAAGDGDDATEGAGSTTTVAGGDRPEVNVDLAGAEADVAAAETAVEQLTAGRVNAARRVDEAQRAFEDARHDLTEARHTAEAAQAELERIRLEFEAAQQAVEDSRTRTERATAAADQADSDLDVAEGELRAWEDELNQAREAAEAARERRRTARLRGQI